MSDLIRRLRANADLDEIEGATDSVVALEREAAAHIEAQDKRIAHLEKEEEISESVISAFSKLLAEIAITLKGEELPLHRHSYHDLPELVSVLHMENDLRKYGGEKRDKRIAELEAQLAELRIANASYDNRIKYMGESLAEASKDAGRLRETLNGIATAKRFDRKSFDDDEAFAAWAQSRARHAMQGSAT